VSKPTIRIKNFSKHLQSADSYLKESFPEILITKALLKSHLQESFNDSNDRFNSAQGELLCLGTTCSRKAEHFEKQWKGMCLVFPSGELRTNISNFQPNLTNVGIASIRWGSISDDSENRLQIPFITEKWEIGIGLKQKIQQIVFPSSSAENLNSTRRIFSFNLDVFAVRSMNEVAILECSRIEDKRPYLRHCFTLPLPSLRMSASNYIADVSFDASGSQIFTITDTGHWTVCEVSVQTENAAILASGSLKLNTLPNGEARTNWWKTQWMEDTIHLLICESKALHLLNPSVLHFWMNLI
jgi:RNA polymerase I-specific transcription-initiation factor